MLHWWWWENTSPAVMREWNTVHHGHIQNSVDFEVEWFLLIKSGEHASLPWLVLPFPPMISLSIWMWGSFPDCQCLLLYRATRTRGDIAIPLIRNVLTRETHTVQTLLWFNIRMWHLSTQPLFKVSLLASLCINRTFRDIYQDKVWQLLHWVWGHLKGTKGKIDNNRVIASTGA